MTDGWFAGSLRRRLIVQLLVVAAVLAVALYFAVRQTADRAAEATQDAILGAAAVSVADALRGTEQGVEVDLSYATFSMLGAVAQDRLFWRIVIRDGTGGETLTGYDDLPLPVILPASPAPAFYSRPFRDADLRLAAVGRSVLAGDRLRGVVVVLGQTRYGQAQVAGQLANRAALLGLGFFVLAVPLSLLAAGSMLAPLDRLAQAVARRGPRDLRPVRHPSPRELAPLVTALNNFTARLRGALTQTETFIAEAAHHIRTPLATVRAEAELALRRAETEDTRARLRTVIRAVEESARSASQLLDHAMVLYRSDQMEPATLDLRQTLADLARAYAPTADMRDIAITLDPGPGPARVRGDPVLIESALRNLIDNAVKYSDADGEVHLSLTVAPGRVAVTVADRGRGLSGAVTPDLTARFRRGRNVADVVGSGLGLTIVAEVARALGGEFTMGPRPGGGTCACLTLPAA
ncbi:MAG: sensor histidine kinase N-terminal domain-containing protein [Gemmobacter sp.]